jgi:hypothetical protein
LCAGILRAEAEGLSRDEILSIIEPTRALQDQSPFIISIIALLR